MDCRGVRGIEVERVFHMEEVTDLFERRRIYILLTFRNCLRMLYLVGEEC